MLRPLTMTELSRTRLSIHGSRDTATGHSPGVPRRSTMFLLLNCDPVSVRSAGHPITMTLEIR